MPYEAKKTPSCPVSEPWGVFNKDTGELGFRCHSSRASALAQMRAMYANEKNMNSEVGVYSDMKVFAESKWLNGNRKWVMIYPFSSWTHPFFEDTAIDEETADILKASFDNKYYGTQEYPVTYDHGMDPAKGGKAAGWFEQLEVRDDGLWALIRFTDEARTEIDNEEWKYMSGEHWDAWTNPHTGQTNYLVFCGGALTNKPYVKDGMAPLNFSEVFIDKGKEGGGMDPEDKKVTPEPTGEHVEQEHGDPGEVTDDSGRAPDKTDKDNSNRFDGPPIVREDPESSVENNNETPLDAKLREALGLDPEADIIKFVTDMHTEVAPLREAAKAHSEKKAFAELYPVEARRLQELETTDRLNKAKAFSEKYIHVVDSNGVNTNKGFSAIVVNKLAEVHKKFSDGNGNINDITEVLDLVASTGLVDYQETGSSRVDPKIDDKINGAKAFSEKVAEIQESDKVDYATATRLTIDRHPDLFDAYRSSLPGRTN